MYSRSRSAVGKLRCWLNRKAKYDYVTLADVDQKTTELNLNYLIKPFQCAHYVVLSRTKYSPHSGDLTQQVRRTRSASAGRTNPNLVAGSSPHKLRMRLAI